MVRNKLSAFETSDTAAAQTGNIFFSLCRQKRKYIRISLWHSCKFPMAMCLFCLLTLLNEALILQVFPPKRKEEQRQWWFAKGRRLDSACSIKLLSNYTWIDSLLCLTRSTIAHSLSHADMHAHSHRDLWGPHVQLWTVCEPQLGGETLRERWMACSVVFCLLSVRALPSVKRRAHTSVSATCLSHRKIPQTTPL